LAAAEYGTALKLDNKRVDAHYGLGLTYAAQKNKALAQKVLSDLKILDASKAGKLQIEINKIQ